MNSMTSQALQRWSLNQLHDHPWLEGEATCISESANHEPGIERKDDISGEISPRSEAGGECKLSIPGLFPGDTSVQNVAMSPSASTTKPSDSKNQTKFRASLNPSHKDVSGSGPVLMPSRSRQRPHSAETGKRSLGARRKQNLSVSTGYVSERLTP